MNIRHLSIALASVTLLGFTASADAAKPKKAGHEGQVLSHLDRDQNGTIDGKEATRAQAMYAALAALDTDKNGQLSESELSAAKVPPAGAKKKKKNK